MSGRHHRAPATDPGRAYLPRDRLDPVASYLVPTSRDLEDRDSRDTTVYRWHR
ncbi:MAG: hypothetical protein ACREFD_14370 [Stellaceae bacterium]